MKYTKIQKKQINYILNQLIKDTLLKKIKWKRYTASGLSFRASKNSTIISLTKMKYIDEWCNTIALSTLMDDKYSILIALDNTIFPRSITNIKLIALYYLVSWKKRYIRSYENEINKDHKDHLEGLYKEYLMEKLAGLK